MSTKQFEKTNMFLSFQIPNMFSYLEFEKTKTGKEASAHLPSSLVKKVTKCIKTNEKSKQSKDKEEEASPNLQVSPAR